MMAMDHAEAHERLVDLALEPGGLERLDLEREGATTSEERAFVEHVRSCPTCSADLAATRVIRDRLDLAIANLPDDAAVAPIAPPEWLRDAVLADARGEPRPAASSPGREGDTRVPAGPARRWLPTWTPRRWAAGLAATLVIGLVGGVLGSALQSRISPEPSITGVVATLDRVLAAPDHRLVSLRSTTGAASGSVAWTASDFAVLTSSLAAPTGDRVYRCWLEWSGRWAAMGVMELANGTAYWTGPTAEWARALAEPDARLVVTLEPAGAPAEEPTGPTVLEAALGT